MPSTPDETLIYALRHARVLNAPLEAAFRAVPRAAFLPHLSPNDVYKDEAVPIKVDEDGTVLSSSSQPSMMAIMLRQLQLQPAMNVLEIGTGTGYNAALMQHLVGDEGKVTTIEIDGSVAELARANLQRAAMSQVYIVVGDGALGYAPRASYDRIMATAGIWDVPRAWVRQMKPKGILVAPLWLDGFEVSAALSLQSDGTLYSSDNRLCGFLRLRGDAAGPNMSTRVGTSGLHLWASAGIDPVAVQMLLSDDAEDTHLRTSLDSGEYWQGFLPYFVLQFPDNFSLARYAVNKDMPAYGLQGSGFVLLTNGSACFVPTSARGSARCFGSSDALLAVEDALAAWIRDGKPQQDRLRLRLVPKDSFSFAVQRGKVYPRRDHAVIVWME